MFTIDDAKHNNVVWLWCDFIFYCPVLHERLYASFVHRKKLGELSLSLDVHKQTLIILQIKALPSDNTPAHPMDELGGLLTALAANHCHCEPRGGPRFVPPWSSRTFQTLSVLPQPAPSRRQLWRQWMASQEMADLTRMEIIVGTLEKGGCRMMTTVVVVEET